MGWVKLWRCLTESSLMSCPNLCHFFIYCLLKASRQDREGRSGVEAVQLQPGQFIFGRHKAAKETGLSEQQIRTAIKHLVAEKRLKTTIHPSRQFSVITVCNWQDYQDDNNELPDQRQPTVNQPPTSRQPAANQPPTTDKKLKKLKNVENVEKTYLPPKKIGGEQERKKRRQDPIWDTVCEVFGLKPVTETEKHRTGKIVKELKQKQATPEDITKCYNAYRTRWPTMAATPTAIMKHWDSLQTEPPADDPGDVLRDKMLEK